jgi:hypothetical protein
LRSAQQRDGLERSHAPGVHLVREQKLPTPQLGAVAMAHAVQGNADDRALVERPAVFRQAGRNVRVVVLDL